MPRLVFHNPTKEALEHIWKAESELNEAGVTFDVGQSMCEAEVISRDWELDWSLSGAEIISDKK